MNPLKADKLERSLRLANNNAKENDDLDDIDDILHGMFICIECMYLRVHLLIIAFIKLLYLNTAYLQVTFAF